jgi:hypothetical protein
VEGDKRRLYRCCGAAAAFLPRGFLSGGGGAPVMRMVNSDMVVVLVEVSVLESLEEVELWKKGEKSKQASYLSC